MTSVGETFRRERLRRDLKLGDISRELRISVRFLQAIEDEDFDKLPGGVFARSFVRQYAGYLGLDADELAGEVQRALEPPPAADALPKKSRIEVPGLRPMREKVSWRSIGEGRSSRSSWVPAAVLVIAAMLVSSGVYWWWWERPRHQAVTHATVPPPAPPPKAAAPASSVPSVPAPAVEAASPASQPPAQPSATAPPQATQVATAPPGASTAPPAVAPPGTEPNPHAAVRVEIAATEAVWVRASADGKYLFSGTLQPHERRYADGDTTVVLLLGNAAGASITLNGKPIAVEGQPAGIAGPKGQVRTVQLTSGGFQIVPPKAPDLR